MSDDIFIEVIYDIESHLEGDVSHGFGQVISLQTVPVVQMFP